VLLTSIRTVAVLPPNVAVVPSSKRVTVPSLPTIVGIESVFAGRVFVMSATKLRDGGYCA
jgi:hypothetical protein